MKAFASKSKPLSLLGAGPDATVVDCSDLGMRCLSVTDVMGGEEVWIEGIHFANGMAPSLPAPAPPEEEEVSSSLRRSRSSSQT